MARRKSNAKKLPKQRQPTSRRKSTAKKLPKQRQPASISDTVKFPSIIRVGRKYQAKIPTGVDKDDNTDYFLFGDDATTSHDSIKINNLSEMETSIELEDKGLLTHPASFDDSWSLAEHGNFLLGLYIHEQNFHAVNEFMGKKGMGNVLLHYYGEFYKSKDYNTWSKWKKERRRRPEDAQTPFTGLRKYELLSCLSSNSPQECKDRLEEAFENCERLLLKDFIYTLKEIVGLNLLVEALAIGQVENDLLQFPKTGNSVPIGYEYSSLTKQEIIGNLRHQLCKGKSNALFQGAVWPRLLARGWKASQPIDHVPSDSKNILYLVPGVSAFSSTELTKGIHYFDSVHEILDKISSEPELLDLESDQDKPVDPDVDQDSDDEKKHTCLQIQGPQRNQDSEIFTNVDAALDNGMDGSFKMMHLTGSAAHEPAYEPKQWPDGRLEPDVNHFSHKKERNGYLHPNVQSYQDWKTFTIADTSLDYDRHRLIKVLELTILLVSENVETDKQEVAESNQSVFGSPNGVSSTMKYDLVNHPYETSNNNDFQEKSTPGNCKFERSSKIQGIMEERNHPQMASGLDCEELTVSPKPTSNQPKCSYAGANRVQQPVLVPQRHSMRNRILTTKALDAIAYGYLSPKRKRKGEDEMPYRRVSGKTDAISSDGAGDIDKVEDGTTSDATKRVQESPKGRQF